MKLRIETLFYNRVEKSKEKEVNQNIKQENPTDNTERANSEKYRWSIRDIQNTVKVSDINMLEIQRRKERI